MPKIKSPLGDILHPSSSHESLFPNVEDSKFAIQGILRTYFGENSPSDDDYLFFKASVVRFEEEPELDLELDHRKRIVIFIVKEPTGIDVETRKKEIRAKFAMEFATHASDARERTALTIYRSLDPEARKALIEREKDRELKQNKRE